MTEKSRQIFEFGPYRIDVTERILSRDGEPTVLSPRVFDLLALLVQNHGHLMEKEELIARLWPDSYVEEANLNVNVSTLRRALGESASDSHFIETVPRRGYRFVAAVTEVVSTSEDASVSDRSPVVELATIAAPPKVKRWVLWSMGLFVLLMAGSLAAWRFAHLTSNRNKTKIHTLAVLPFKSLTNDSNDAALEMGMADALITRLSNSREIVVRSTSSVVKYSVPQTDSLAAGRELEVDAVLEGRVQRADNRIRVTVQLLRVADGKPIWAERFDDYFTNIFAVQDSISEKMATALAMHLGDDTPDIRARRPTENTEAYQLYLQGKYFYFKYNFEKSRTFFEGAIEKDHEYPLAHAGAALAYLALSLTTHSEEYRSKAITSADRAVALGPELEEAHEARGWIKYLGEWNWAVAEEEFQRALQINPNHAQSRIDYSLLLTCLGRQEEALRQGEVALQLDPVSGDIYFNHMLNLYLARRYDQALEISKRGMEVDPDIPGWNSVLSKISLVQSHYEEAIARTEKKTTAGRPSVILGYAYAKLGRRAEAEAVIAALKKGEYPNNCAVAVIYVALNDKEQALDSLEKAYEKRENILTELKVEPLYDPLRSEPRFAQLLRRMKLE